MSSHASAPVTASLLTILCVALVHRDRPDWLAVGVGDAARAAALSPERVSRLASRVAHPFADIVDTFTRRGRPTRIDDPVRAELVTLRALLAVATAALALVPLRRPAIGAQQRLRQQHHEADDADRARSADPARWLRQALDLIALQWLPSAGHLLFDGPGLGVGWMRAALDLLLRRHGCNAGNDIAAGVLDQFRLACLPSATPPSPLRN